MLKESSYSVGFHKSYWPPADDAVILAVYWTKHRGKLLPMYDGSYHVYGSNMPIGMFLNDPEIKIMDDRVKPTGNAWNIRIIGLEECREN